MAYPRALLTICVLTLLAAVRPSVGGELCVICEVPHATYRCQARLAPDGENLHASASQLLCIKELAKLGGHQSCSVERAATTVCEGEVVSVFPPVGTVLPAAPIPSETATHQLRPPPPAEYIPPHDPEKPSGNEPATVEELAQDTATSTKKGLKNVGNAVSDSGKFVVDTAKKTGGKIGDAAETAGGAVGGAAKKTWNCLSSFFSKC